MKMRFRSPRREGRVPQSRIEIKGKPTTLLMYSTSSLRASFLSDVGIKLKKRRRLAAELKPRPTLHLSPVRVSRAPPLGASMAFVSFIGRVLFVSAFILSAWQEYNEFGVDGGLAARNLRPKFDALSQNVLSQTGFKLPAVEMKYLVATTIAVKGLGSLLFIFGSTFGAYLLIVYQALSTPILYDFYNYGADKKQFSPLFAKFTQNVQLLGALLFFIAMKKMIVRRQMRKKTTKTKTM